MKMTNSSYRIKLEEYWEIKLKKNKKYIVKMMNLQECKIKRKAFYLIETLKEHWIDKYN